MALPTEAGQVRQINRLGVGGDVFLFCSLLRKHAETSPPYDVGWCPSRVQCGRRPRL
jgi:hypothetical protein